MELLTAIKYLESFREDYNISAYFRECIIIDFGQKGFSEIIDIDMANTPIK